MVLWVDKYRPSRLGHLQFHPGLTHRLESMARDADNLPHLLFHGPSGAGKRTRVFCLLREIYGSGAAKVRFD
jgi:replication factor C subunit 3/5